MKDKLPSYETVEAKKTLDRISEFIEWLERVNTVDKDLVDRFWEQLTPAAKTQWSRIRKIMEERPIS